jgi:hypothetical protein
MHHDVSQNSLTTPSPPHGAAGLPADGAKVLRHIAFPRVLRCAVRREVGRPADVTQQRRMRTDDAPS